MNLQEEEGVAKLAAMSVFYKNMQEFLDNLTFGQESDLKRCGGKTYTSDSVTLMTLHGSKRPGISSRSDVRSQKGLDTAGERQAGDR